MRQKYQREVTGLLFNTTSFVVFGFKAFLFMVECQRYQFTMHISQLTFVPAVENLAAKVSTKSSSLAYNILMPLSQFLFCTVAIMFAFLHPSALFVPFIPLLIMAYFSDFRDHASCCNMFRLSSRLFIFVTTVFIVALYAYQLYTLNQKQTLLSKWKEQKDRSGEFSTILELTGILGAVNVTKSLAMRQLFPAYYEMLFMLCLSTFARYANQKQEPRKKGEAGPGVKLEFKSEDVIHGPSGSVLSESLDETIGGEDSMRQ